MSWSRHSMLSPYAAQRFPGGRAPEKKYVEYELDDCVEARDLAGNWYLAVATAAEGDAQLFHFVGWDTAWNEWMDAAVIKRRIRAVSARPHVGPHRQGISGCPKDADFCFSLWANHPDGIAANPFAAAALPAPTAPILPAQAAAAQVAPAASPRPPTLGLGDRGWSGGPRVCSGCERTLGNAGALAIHARSCVPVASPAVQPFPAAGAAAVPTAAAQAGAAASLGIAVSTVPALGADPPPPLGIPVLPPSGASSSRGRQRRKRRHHDGGILGDGSDDDDWAPSHDMDSRQQRHDTLLDSSRSDSAKGGGGRGRHSSGPPVPIVRARAPAPKGLAADETSPYQALPRTHYDHLVGYRVKLRDGREGSIAGGNGHGYVAVNMQQSVGRQEFVRRSVIVKMFAPADDPTPPGQEIPVSELLPPARGAQPSMIDSQVTLKSGKKGKIVGSSHGYFEIDLEGGGKQYTRGRLIAEFHGDGGGGSGAGGGASTYVPPPVQPARPRAPRAKQPPPRRKPVLLGDSESDSESSSSSSSSSDNGFTRSSGLDIDEEEGQRRRQRREGGAEPGVAAAVDSLLQLVRGAMDGERQRSVIFEQLPTRRELPSYYAQIALPTDLQRIERRAKAGTYTTLRQAISELQLMLENAREYNIEGSQIYLDSLVLSDAVSRYRHAALKTAHHTTLEVHGADGSQSHACSPHAKRQRSGAPRKPPPPAWPPAGTSSQAPGGPGYGTIGAQGHAAKRSGPPAPERQSASALPWPSDESMKLRDVAELEKWIERNCAGAEQLPRGMATWERCALKLGTGRCAAECQAEWRAKFASPLPAPQMPLPARGAECAPPQQPQPPSQQQMQPPQQPQQMQPPLTL